MWTMAFLWPSSSLHHCFLRQPLDRTAEHAECRIGRRCAVSHSAHRGPSAMVWHFEDG